MLKIKLSPTGKKGRIHYRVSVMENRSKLTSDPVEVLGFYNPHDKKTEIDIDRVKYWISQGAEVTPKIKSLCKIS